MISFSTYWQQSLVSIYFGNMAVGYKAGWSGLNSEVQTLNQKMNQRIKFIVIGKPLLEILIHSSKRLPR